MGRLPRTLLVLFCFPRQSSTRPLSRLRRKEPGDKRWRETNLVCTPINGQLVIDRTDGCLREKSQRVLFRSSSRPTPSGNAPRPKVGSQGSGQRASYSVVSRHPPTPPVSGSDARPAVER
ncbi:hypothetical protein QBC47DRAFT_369032 [Echria macrotheca]|uniref:Uncharacterized protein n=1 Tax=Echria macrotheca TaxID=438768 RepID=A0AAJ0BQD3_9PEZI|nr:hypothetical protein QBC47DRAFT_369032 [Echria macrotheca]